MTARTRMTPLLRARIASLVVTLLVLAAWLLVLPRLTLTTSITHFLPELADRDAARLAKAIAEGPASRTMILDVSGDEPAALAATAKKLVVALRADPRTESVRSGVDDEAQRAIFELFAKRSPTALLTTSDLDDAAIRARLEKQKARLASPMGPFVRELTRTDPLGGTLGAIEALGDFDAGGTESEDGVLFTADRTHAFVFATTRAGAFDATAQRAYQDLVATAFLTARGSAQQHLEQSGIGRVTIAAESQIRGDIERIGGISTLGIVLLFALLFRSPRMLGLGLLPLWFGSAVAMVATHVAFGEIHGLTLAFGSSLLGVGIDYAEHYFSHFALTPEHGPRDVMRGVWPGLWMGALTTIVGFSGLGLTGFPGIRQIAFFSAVAIVAALIATRVLLPPWMPAQYTRPRVMGLLLAWTERLVARPEPAGNARARETDARTARAGGRRFLFATAILVVAFVPGLVRARFVDDVAILLALDPGLMAEDTRVRERVSPLDPGRFAVVVRPNEEDALAALERTTAALAAASRDGLVSRPIPLGAILHPRATQAATFARAKQDRARIRATMAEAGFVPEAFDPFFATLDADAPRLLTLDDVARSPLGEIVRPLAPRIPEGQAFVIPLAGVRDAEALKQRLPDAIVIDEPALLERTYRAVRTHTIRMLFVGCALVALVLVLRYRSAPLTIAALVPGALGAVGAISVAGWLGTPINVLHLVGTLLVLSMGVDYGIFVVEGRANETTSAHSLVSIITATSTTLLSFGLLALSPSPALRALGTTITVGLLLAAILCPLASVVLAAATRATNAPSEPEAS